VIGQLVPIVLVGVLAFALTSVLVIPGVRNSIAGFATDLRLRFLPEIVDVHPVAVRGAGVGRNTAMLAIDDNTATFWLADPKAGAPTVTAEFAAPINLGGIVVHSGSTTDSDFIRHRRPKTIELSFPGTDRPPVDLVLADTADPQALAVDVRDVRTTAIRIVDWFESAAGGDALLAVREIELKERR
jgi:hypothetical protein